MNIHGILSVVQEASTDAVTSKNLAADYLSSKIDDITDPFQMAITAYALQSASHKSRDDAFNKLRYMNRSGK